MTCQRLDDGSVLIRQLNAFEYNTLWELPNLADPAGHEGAENRLYPPPYLEGEATEEQQSDWDEYVRPELEELIGASFAHVVGDLEKAVHDEPPEPREFPVRKPRLIAPAKAAIRAPRRAKIQPPAPETAIAQPDAPASEPEPVPPPPQRWTFSIPEEHIEDWFRAMNAARLVMSQRHDCHRTDMEYVLSAINSGSTTHLVQYSLLTSLCHWWINALLR